MNDDEAPAEERRLSPIVLAVGETNAGVGVLIAAALHQPGLTVVGGADRQARPGGGIPDIFRDVPDIQGTSILAEFDRQRSYALPWERKANRKRSARRPGGKRR